MFLQQGGLRCSSIRVLWVILWLLVCTSHAGASAIEPTEPTCTTESCPSTGESDTGNVLFQFQTKRQKKQDVTNVDVPRHHRMVFLAGMSSESWAKVPCDVPCFWQTGQAYGHQYCNDPDSLWCDRTEFHQIEFGNTAKPIRVQGAQGLFSSLMFEGMNEELKISMESGVNYPDLQRDLEHKGTTSLKSAVPFQYFSWGEGQFKEAVHYDSVEKGASFLARNCNPSSDRNDLVRALQKYIRVDSMGSCMHNAEKPKGTHDDKMLIMERFLFHLAFENSIEPDYVTEKLWGSLQSGTLPIYLGAPNIHELVPPRSVIVVQDFDSWDDLGQHLRHLMQNKTAYEEYHLWRKGPLPESFIKKWDFAHVHSNCRVCRWAFAKREHLKWDIPTQRVLNITV